MSAFSSKSSTARVQPTLKRAGVEQGKLSPVPVQAQLTVPTGKSEVIPPGFDPKVWAGLDMATKSAIWKSVATATAKPERKLSCKVSAKGGLSIYGLNSRFPVTLYKGQWDRLLGYADSIRQFMKDNAHLLAEKAPVGEVEQESGVTSEG